MESVGGGGGDENEKEIRTGCGSKQPTIKKEGLKFIAVFKQSPNDESGEPSKTQLTNQKIYSILKRISDEDCRRMGLDPDWARPDW